MNDIKEPTEPCDCWEKTNAMLKEKGFRLNPSLTAIRWTADGPLSPSYQLPLQRADGSKVRRSDPQTIQIPHCPWCGKKYPKASTTESPEA